MAPVRLFVFVGHPSKHSLSKSLADSYARGAESRGVEIRRQNVADMSFDSDLTNGYRKGKTLEPCLVKWRENVQWATHMVWVYPMWWGGMPAKMKGVVDRALLPGFGFQFHEGKPLPEKLLKGRLADVYMTTDTPRWYLSLVLRNPGYNNVTKQVLGFCGINTRRFRHFSGASKATASKADKWMEQVRRDGQSLENKGSV